MIHAMQREENMMMKNNYLLTKLFNINVLKGENIEETQKK